MAERRRDYQEVLPGMEKPGRAPVQEDTFPHVDSLLGVPHRWDSSRESTAVNSQKDLGAEELIVPEIVGSFEIGKGTMVWPNHGGNGKVLNAFRADKTGKRSKGLTEGIARERFRMFYDGNEWEEPSGTHFSTYSRKFKSRKK